MLSNISYYLWIVTTLIIVLFGVYLLIYNNFISIKVLKKCKSISKENIKLLNLSLAGKIGVGSISGIAISIIIGGPGTIFWIWLSSIILSIYTYLEVKSGILYKEKINNQVIGGPSVYIKNVLHNNKLSIIYSLLIIFTFLFSFILIQSNTIIISINYLTFINKKIIMLILLFIVYISINKGISIISKIVSILVPLMSFIYIIVGIIIIFKNINIIPIIIKSIIINAFSFKSIIFLPFIIGFQRSIFSNEAGMGTTAIVSSLSNNNYKEEVFFQIIGTYFITLVICTISALVIMTSNFESNIVLGSNGIEIINYAFYYHFKDFGLIISTIIITLFAFSTIITSYFYGDISIKYLFNNKKSTITKFIVIIVIMLSLYIDPLSIWSIVDISVSLTSLINIYALLKLRKKLKYGDEKNDR